MTESCETCRFWKQQDEEATGWIDCAVRTTPVTGEPNLDGVPKPGWVVENNEMTDAETSRTASKHVISMEVMANPMITKTG